MAKSKPKLKFPKRKISDSLLQFAEPLLAEVKSNEAKTEIRSSIMIAWTVWNAVVYADVASDVDALDELQASTESDPSYKAFVEYMVQRKRTLFGDDERLVGEFEVLFEDGGVRLWAEARDPRSRGR